MSTNQLISIGLYAVLSMGAVCALYGWMQARSFVTTFPSVESQRDLDEFKRVVKTNMYLALAMMVLAVIAVVLGVSGMLLGSLGWLELRLVLFIMGPVCGFSGAALTAAEGRMKRVLVSDDALRVEFDAVVQRWASSPIPNW